MHAIGDRAVRNALDACEAARTANGARDSRHHIAHLQVIHPDDVPRFRQLGVIANCQPYWAQHDPQMDELTIPFLGPDRAPLQYPFAALHASGASLAFGSDWSVSTANPLEEMEVAIRRADPSTREVRAVPSRPAPAPPRGPRRVHEGCILRQPRRRRRLDRRGESGRPGRARPEPLRRSPTPPWPMPAWSTRSPPVAWSPLPAEPLVARTGHVRQTPTVGPTREGVA